MDYEEITESLIQDVLREFKLEDEYQEFLDSLVKCNNFKNLAFESFKEYLDNQETL